MVVDWERTDVPADGLIPACVRWTAGYGFRRAIVTAWAGGEAEAVGVDAHGERHPAGRGPDARAAAEAWLLG